MAMYLRVDELPIPTDGLLGYRPLQENLNDESGNGKNGSWYSGTGSFLTIGGKTGAGITSDGNNSTQHIVTTLNYSGPSVSMCGWVYYTDLTSQSGLRPAIMTNTATDVENSYISLSPRPSQSNRWTVGVAGNLLTSTTSATTGGWLFVCGVLTSSGKKIYVNGTLISNDSSGVTTGQGGIWRLGCGQVGASLDGDFGGFTGLLKHCAVYNRTLTDAEINSIYTATA